jgi:hypothetical protein
MMVTSYFGIKSFPTSAERFNEVNLRVKLLTKFI